MGRQDIEAMDQALSILQAAEIPLLVRLAAFHYFFEYIYPFYDGNGRTGRFIVSYYLSREFSPYIALQLSVEINKRKMHITKCLRRRTVSGIEAI